MAYPFSMLLAQVVDASAQMTATSKRLAKIEVLAHLLKQLTPEEILITVPYLSGAVRQGKIGIGYASLSAASVSPAPLASLQVTEVDQTFGAIARRRGNARLEPLTTLFSRATDREQHFLRGLLTGELRQGALEGIMIEALAKASGTAVERVRRAAMLAGDLAPVAQAALTQGEAGLAQYDVQLLRPLQPMLAQTAEDVARSANRTGRGFARIQTRWRPRPGPQIRQRRDRIFARPQRCHRGCA